MSSETEWVALLKAMKEVLFVIQQLRSIKVSVKFHMKMRVDSVGAIVMAGNTLATSSTNHVAIRYKYVKKYVED